MTGKSIFGFRRSTWPQDKASKSHRCGPRCVGGILLRNVAEQTDVLRSATKGESSLILTVGSFERTGFEKVFCAVKARKDSSGFGRNEDLLAILVCLHFPVHCLTCCLFSSAFVRLLEVLVCFLAQGFETNPPTEPNTRTKSIPIQNDGGTIAFFSCGTSLISLEIRLVVTHTYHSESSNGGSHALFCIWDLWWIEIMHVHIQILYRRRWRRPMIC